MASVRHCATLRTTRRLEMEALWTTASYAVFSSGALLAAYILARWVGAGRRGATTLARDKEGR
jgi:hypothetical protein